ncbi:MAG: hypothetical protein ACKO2N_00205 [Tabrizicola sp.]
MPKLAFAVLGSLAVLAACAKQPDPVVPEPVYDKFGHLEDVCVSDSQLQDPNYQPPMRQLPRCEDRCKQGEQPTFTVAGQWPICVPRPDDGSKDPDPQDPQRPRAFN